MVLEPLFQLLALVIFSLFGELHRITYLSGINYITGLTILCHHLDHKVFIPSSFQDAPAVAEEERPRVIKTRTSWNTLETLAQLSLIDLN